MAAPAPAAGVPAVVSAGSGLPVGKTVSTSKTVTDTVTGESEPTHADYAQCAGHNAQ